MNLHMVPPNPGPGGHPLLLEWKCCRMPVRDPPLAWSARAPGQLGIRRAGCWAPGRPQPTPLCFYRPTAVSTWDKAPETHRPPVGPPAPSPAGSSGHRRWTGHGFGWSRCSVASHKCSRSTVRVHFGATTLARTTAPRNWTLQGPAPPMDLGSGLGRAGIGLEVQVLHLGHVARSHH